MKVMLVCSAGGHLAELERLTAAFVGHDLSLVTYFGPRGAEPMAGIGTTYLIENIGASPLKLLRGLPTILRALLRERPDAIVSTGSEIAIPFFYLARLLRIHSLYIESWCRVRTRSGTGRFVYPIVDRFFVQWPALLEQYGSKAELMGRVL
jgi:UDP-N-acetylglucosamine:LPS N-acetylglucosamine transferase